MATFRDVIAKIQIYLWCAGITPQFKIIWFSIKTRVKMVKMRSIKYHMEWKPTDVTILFVYCWISACFGPTGPSSGEFVQLFTQPLVQFLCRSVRVLCVLWAQSTRTERHRNWTNGCVNSCTNSPEDGPVGPKHVEIQQYTKKIVTSVGFHSICWKDARYKKLKMLFCTTSQGICKSRT